MRLLVILFPLLCVLGAVDATAQGFNVASDTLVWTVTQLDDVASDTTMSYNCKFVSYGDSGLTWIQQNGEYLSEFTVADVTGSWTDSGESGTIDLTVTYFDRGGHITFSRVSDQLTISLQLTGVDPLSFVFHVSSLEKQIP